MTEVNFTTWGVFADQNHALAAFCVERLDAGPTYLATLRSDGSPRVHPTSCRVAGGRLGLLMFPSSPKGHDLRRDPRYALHATVDDRHGSGGEVAIRGSARAVEDDRLIDEMDRAGFPQRDGYVVFELSVDRVLVATYDGTSNRPTFRRWSSETGETR